MAAVHVTTASILSSFLPRFAQPAVSRLSRTVTLTSRDLALPLLPSLSINIPAAISLNVPGLLQEIWDGILKAVPKKKTSYMKKRSRFMAGKGLKDLTALCRCSGCGQLKRAHILCPYCVADIKNLWKGRMTNMLGNIKKARKGMSKKDSPPADP